MLDCRVVGVGAGVGSLGKERKASMRNVGSDIEGNTSAPNANTQMPTEMLGFSALLGERGEMVEKMLSCWSRDLQSRVGVDGRGGRSSGGR